MTVLQARPDAEAELAGALACDLERSFEYVVIAYRDHVVTFVARMLRDDARSEDVAQDVFVRAYRALQTYEPERRRTLRLRSWLLAIAHNLTRNALRDAPPRAESLEWEDGSPIAAAADPSPGPETHAARAETMHAIERAVAQLSPRLRPAFVMRYLDETPYDEIAHALQQPLGTVKASAHRALLAVRAHLENEYD